MAAKRIPKGWRETENRLTCSYTFKDFAHAMGFLNEVALRAQERQHHPDFRVHWNEVHFEVWSHDAGGVTERDHALVKEIAEVASRVGAKVSGAGR